MRKNRSTLLHRRRTAVIVSCILLVLLIISLIFVLDYVNATSVEVDGTTYYIREKKNVYGLYDTDKKTLMPTEEQYGYYVTHAGTLIKIDAETGEYEIFASVDTEGSEALIAGRRLLLFPHIEKKNILKIEVFNEEGNYTFSRLNLTTGLEDPASDFVIKQSPINAFDEELFASLYVTCGYTLSALKVTDPIKDSNGLYSEYGLVPETRRREVLDENGEFVLDENLEYVYEEYEYVPAYYIITDISGKQHKVIIGDRLVSGDGYYAQYEDMSTGVKRDAVYVFTDDIAETLFAPVEDFVTPQIVYPMSTNTYLWVNKFSVWQKNPNYDPNVADSLPYNIPVYASFVPLADRQGTINAFNSFVFEKGSGLEGYGVSSDSMNAVLWSIFQPSYEGVVKLAPTDEDLAKYGLSSKTVGEDGKEVYELDFDYRISFNYDVYDENEENVLSTVNNRVYVSEIDGKFYAYTVITPIDKDGKEDAEGAYSFDMIVEVSPHTLAFLEWDQFDWIDKNYVSLNIAHTSKIELWDHVSGYNSVFTLDNSKSDQSQNVSSTLLSVTASDSNGNNRTTFSSLSVLDKDSNVWIITASEVKCYNPSGQEIESIPSAQYVYNSIGKQVKICKDKIVCADGTYVTVNADTIIVEGAQSRTISRFDTDLFRRFFLTIVTSTVSDSYTMTETEESDVLADPERLLLTLKVTDYLGNTKEYKFYKLTSRKAYITVNGDGGFYVLSSRLEKFVADSQRFFALEDIDALGKY